VLILNRRKSSMKTSKWLLVKVTLKSKQQSLLLKRHSLQLRLNQMPKMKIFRQNKLQQMTTLVVWKQQQRKLLPRKACMIKNYQKICLRKSHLKKNLLVMHLLPIVNCRFKSKYNRPRNSKRQSKQLLRRNKVLPLVLQLILQKLPLKRLVR